MKIQSKASVCFMVILMVMNTYAGPTEWLDNQLKEIKSITLDIGQQLYDFTHPGEAMSRKMNQELKDILNEGNTSSEDSFNEDLSTGDKVVDELNAKIDDGILDLGDDLGNVTKSLGGVAPKQNKDGTLDTDKYAEDIINEQGKNLDKELSSSLTPDIVKDIDNARKVADKVSDLGKSLTEETTRHHENQDALSLKQKFPKGEVFNIDELNEVSSVYKIYDKDGSILEPGSSVKIVGYGTKNGEKVAVVEKVKEESLGFENLNETMIPDVSNQAAIQKYDFDKLRNTHESVKGQSFDEIMKSYAEYAKTEIENIPQGKIPVTELSDNAKQKLVPYISEMYLEPKKYDEFVKIIKETNVQYMPHIVYKNDRPINKGLVTSSYFTGGKDMNGKSLVLKDIHVYSS